jgi:hypothetical protein
VEEIIGIMSLDLFEPKQTLFSNRMLKYDKCEVNAVFHEGCRMPGSMRPNNVRGITILLYTHAEFRTYLALRNDHGGYKTL